MRPHGLGSGFRSRFRRQSTRTGCGLLCLFALLGGRRIGQGWDYEGHRLVNQLALRALPDSFPSFVTTARARERIAFLSGEPDRWRNNNQPALRHSNAPDHFLDLDELPAYGLEAGALPIRRYEFVELLWKAQLRDGAPALTPNPPSDSEETLHLIGFLPWAITENFAKLQSAFSYLKVFEDLGTREEVSNARENVLYVMGVLGHYVGDGSQPLHLTRHYNGWVGSNPSGFTTNHTFHAWIDGGYLRQFPLDLPALQQRVLPVGTSAAFSHATNIFGKVMTYLIDSSVLVLPLYEMEKDGKFSARSPTEEGRAFLATQIVRGSQMLAELWQVAWQSAPPDPYLRAQLARRKLEKEEP